MSKEEAVVHLKTAITEISKGEFESANSELDMILDSEDVNAQAYFFKTLALFKVRSIQELKDKKVNISENSFFKCALECATPEYAEKLKKLSLEIINQDTEPTPAPLSENFDSTSEEKYEKAIKAGNTYVNIFDFVKEESDIPKLVDVFISNTKGIDSNSDSIVHLETSLLTAVVFYIFYALPPKDKNMYMIFVLIDDRSMLRMHISSSALRFKDSQLISLRYYEIFCRAFGLDCKAVIFDYKNLGYNNVLDSCKKRFSSMEMPLEFLKGQELLNFLNLAYQELIQKQNNEIDSLRVKNNYRACSCKCSTCCDEHLAYYKEKNEIDAVKKEQESIEEQEKNLILQKKKIITPLNVVRYLGLFRVIKKSFIYLLVSFVLSLILSAIVPSIFSIIGLDYHSIYVSIFGKIESYFFSDSGISLAGLAYIPLIYLIAWLKCIMSLTKERNDYLNGKLDLLHKSKKNIPYAVYSINDLSNQKENCKKEQQELIVIRRKLKTCKYEHLSHVPSVFHKLNILEMTMRNLEVKKDTTWGKYIRDLEERIRKEEQEREKERELQKEKEAKELMIALSIYEAAERKKEQEKREIISNKPPCPNCGGKGISVCPRCRGTGKEPCGNVFLPNYTFGFACTACEGSGKFICQKCFGKG